MFTKSFGNITKKDVAIAGGKGASLGEMTKAGIPVPSGFVVLSSAFEKFIKETKLDVELAAALDKVRIDDMSSIEQTSEHIQARINSSKMPPAIAKEVLQEFLKLKCEFVAVRSSATAEDSSSAAWAGQLDSYLNTTNRTLLENVKRCWASLFTSRAIFYRFEKGLQNEKVSVAVVVQKMVASEVSGIAFSVHPVTQNHDQLIIEAGLGLGEAVVSGQITPDSYVFSKKERRILDRSVSDQNRQLVRMHGGGNEWVVTEGGNEQKLTDSQIVELSSIILRIEKHYNFPCDIEWALEKGKFYIVQSRPITTLKSTRELQADMHIDSQTEKVTNEGNEKLTKQVFEKTLIDEFVEISGKCRFYPFIGTYSPILTFWEWCTDETKEPKNTRIPILMLNRGKETLAVINEDAYRLPTKKTFATYMKGATTIKRLSAPQRKIYKEIEQDYKKFVKLDLRKLPEKKIISQLARSLEHVSQLISETLFAEIMEYENVLDYVGSSHKEKWDKLWVRASHPVFLSFETRRKIDAAKVIRRQKNINDVASTLMYLHTDYFKPKEKEEVLKLVREMKKNLTEIENDAKSTLLALVQEKKSFKKWLASLNSTDRKIAEFVQFVMEERDLRKDPISKSQVMIYFTNKEICRRAGLNKEIITQITVYDSCRGIAWLKEHKKELEERKKGMAALLISKNDVRIQSIDFDYLREEFSRRFFEQNNEGVLQGQSASSGFYKGTVKIIHDIMKIKDFHDGNVLVTGMTRPEFVPLMRRAGAIVTNEGGITCHAAIISRELKKPCVIGTKFATQVFKDGDFVEVDANNGVVRKLESPDSSEKNILGNKNNDIINEYANEQMNSNQIVLEKMFSREKSLMYMMMWDISERIGYKDFIDYDIKDSLFIYDASTKKISVWYNPSDAKKIADLLADGVKKNKKFVDRIISCLNNHWKKILPYLSGKKKLKNIAEFNRYYFGITMWWSAMNTVYPLINNPDISAKDGRTFLEYRKMSEKYTGEMDDVILEFWQRILKNKLKNKNNVSVDLLLAEEAELLFKNKLDAKKLKEIQAREEGYIILREKVCSSQALSKILQDNNYVLKKENTASIKEIKGVSAYKGCARGFVRKIISKSDISNFKEGEILVAETTFPDHVPAMKKAAAFVTDEGGITCHAAIVARELKKPCVIGTKFATQVFKDGDFIEVDANNGVVRKLSELDANENKTSEYKTLANSEQSLHAGFDESPSSDPLLDYFKSNEFDIQIAKTTICALDLVFKVYVSAEKVKGASFNVLYCHFKNLIFREIVPYESMHKLGEAVYANFVKDKKIVSKIRNKATAASRKLDLFWKSYDKKRDASEKKLKLLIALLQDWWAYALLGEDKGKYIEQKIISSLTSRGFSNEEAFRVIGIASHPETKSLLGTERTEFFKLCLYALSSEKLSRIVSRIDITKIEEDGRFLKMIESYTSKYFFKSTTFQDRMIVDVSLVVRDIKEELENHSKKDIENALKDILNESVKIKQSKSALSKIRLNTQEKKDIKLLCDFIAFVDERKETMMKSFFYFFSVLHDLCDKKELNFEEVQFLTIKELFGAIRGKPINKKDIENRRNGVFVTYRPGCEAEMIIGARAKQLFDALQEARRTDNVSGAIANRGSKNIIRGKVKIIHNASGQTIGKDEILVTGMTRIEFVPLMKRALAIVTDEGGIACHAAIVSRELGIPCIIGTKIATQKFKNGEIIELDMKNGNVKKVK